MDYAKRRGFLYYILLMNELNKSLNNNNNNRLETVCHFNVCKGLKMSSEEKMTIMLMMMMTSFCCAVFSMKNNKFFESHYVQSKFLFKVTTVTTLS